MNNKIKAAKKKTLNLVTVTNDDILLLTAQAHAMAEAQEIRGLAMVLECERYKHQIAIGGEYYSDPNIARIPVERLLETIIKRARDMEEFTELTIEH